MRSDLLDSYVFRATRRSHETLREAGFGVEGFDEVRRDPRAARFTIAIVKRTAPAGNGEELDPGDTGGLAYHAAKVLDEDGFGVTLADSIRRFDEDLCFDLRVVAPFDDLFPDDVEGGLDS